MRRTIVSASFGPLFLSMFLVASTAFTRALNAQAPAAGTTVAVKMLDTVDSSSDSAGKQYRASVTKGVTASNGVAIAQGSAATVTLTSSGSGYTAQLSSITINGQPVIVTSSSASVTAAQSAASSAVNSIGSVLGHHVSAPSAVTAVAMGQRVVLPPGTTLTFVLSQPPASSPAAPTAPAASAGQPITASAAPAPLPNPASGPLVATTGQHWWMCRYQDQKDRSKPALGSLMYYALLPSSEPVPGGLNKHFNAYVQQNYKIMDANNAGNGFCRRYSDDAAGRANSMDMMLKQWESSNIQPVQVPWADTPAEDAAIDAKSAATAPAPPPPPGAPFIICATSGGPGMDTYLTGAFQTTRVKHTPSGGNLVDQSILDDFYAYLKQKGYNFKPGSNYGCAVKPTEAEAKADEQKRQSGCSNCGKIVETGWKE